MDLSAEIPFESFREELLHEVGRRILPLGFERHKAHSRFYRQLREKRHVLSLAVSDMFDHLSVTASVAVRFERVEQIRHEGNDYIPAEIWDRSSTLSSHIHDLDAAIPRFWQASQELEIDGVADSIAEAFERVGLPFVEKYSDLQTAFSAVTSEPLPSFVADMSPEARAVTAIAMAFLRGDRKTFDEVVRFQIDDLKKRTGRVIPFVEQLVARLEQRLPRFK